MSNYEVVCTTELKGTMATTDPVLSAAVMATNTHDCYWVVFHGGRWVGKMVAITLDKVEADNIVSGLKMKEQWKNVKNI